jgi:hypothetical protein
MRMPPPGHGHVCATPEYNSGGAAPPVPNDFTRPPHDFAPAPHLDGIELRCEQLARRCRTDTSNSLPKLAGRGHAHNLVILAPRKRSELRNKGALPILDLLENSVL